MNYKHKKLAICGAYPGPIGGTTILVHQLYEGFRMEADFKVSKCDFLKKDGTPHFYLKIVFKVISSILNNDLTIINVSKRGFESLFLPILMASVVTRKRILIRYFGGDASETLLWIPKAARGIFRKNFSKNLAILTETKKNISHFNTFGLSVFQISNSRPQFLGADISQKKFGKVLKLVFIAQLKKSKGVPDVLNAVENLHGVKVDFYGPMEWDVKPEDFQESCNCRYMGIIPLGESQLYMEKYDALIFPTTYSGESHAGVILEANSVGLPVIAYRWNAIPEIVIDGQTGILTEVNNIDSLRNSIIKLRDDIDLRKKLSLNAFNHFNNYFTSDVSIKRIKDILLEDNIKNEGCVLPRFYLPE